MVDDDPGIGLALTRVLGDGAGAHVEAALTCWKALESLRRSRFDLVILDLVFDGGLQGIEFLRHLKDDAQLRNVQVIAMTGEATEADIELCGDLGAVACLEKPIGPQEMIAAAREALDPDAITRKRGWKPRIQILYIEDDDAWPKLLSMWLPRERMKVWSVASRHEFRRLMKRRHILPDCLIMDLYLDGIEDGLTLIEEIKAHPWLQRVPVIACSSTEERQGEAYKRGAVNFFEKSSKNQKIVPAMIQSIVDQHRNNGILIFDDLASHIPQLAGSRLSNYKTAGSADGASLISYS